MAPTLDVLVLLTVVSTTKSYCLTPFSSVLMPVLNVKREQQSSQNNKICHWVTANVIFRKLGDLFQQMNFRFLV